MTDEGPASGPGWTGTKYAFTIRAGKNGPVAVSGTVDVDKQGLVRDLVQTTTLQPVPGEPGVTFTDDVTFSDFGESVLIPRRAAGEARSTTTASRSWATIPI